MLAVSLGSRHSRVEMKCTNILLILVGKMQGL